MTYAYFGPEGTFTHQALLGTLTDQPALPFASVPQALNAVREGLAEAALVPIENSVEGGVSATLDNLSGDRPLQITQEVLLPVAFVLAVRPGTELNQVRRVLTHPHAAAQTRDWTDRHLPQADVVAGGSTAAAAKEVARPDSEFDAAICADVAANLYGLEALVSGIADNPDAVTRFVVVRRPGPVPAVTGADKTTVVVYMHTDRPGSLLELLEQFASRGVNLCRIESRPTKTVLGSYCFSIDAEGHIGEARMAEALMGLKRSSQRVDFLGSYPRADQQPPQVGRGFAEEDFRAAKEWITSLLG
ncbi:prephenate dehydratase [Parenemella sanctibonifatiensis]|uniref:Prephenate dehydratase n=1 Tax=Parenemella sanctibonifatiensis TaxID=2016505 RepID=A0A255EX75_9ACTN|nr:prephenate dehydratase [Parenemella sanctibonifatiensis]OYN85850.1 prephenate dehydratase [Parenemella sanctibonifatiensis]OYN92733.1 prephenate dehydratase [Parenemella sanctibonifatiensis]